MTPGAGLSALVVEDDALIALDLVGVLRGAGFAACEWTTTGEEAVAKAVELRPDLVLMDITLAGTMDGVEAAAAIVERVDLPVVFVSARSDPATLERAGITSPAGYIVKPYSRREVEVVVEMALIRHRLERRVKERDRWLATTLDCIADGVLATDAAGALTLMNPAAEVLVGLAPDEALGAALDDVLVLNQADDGEPIRGLVQAVVEAGGRQLTDAVVMFTRGGRSTPVIVSAAPIVEKGGDARGAVLVLRDISQLRQAEDALRQANAELRQLARELEARNRESTLLIELGERLHACSTIKEVGAVAAADVPKLFPHDAGAIELLGLDSKRLESVASWGGPAGCATPGDPQECLAARSGRPRLFVGPTPERACPSSVPCPGGYACAPMIVQSEVLGLVRVAFAAGPPGEEPQQGQGAVEVKARLVAAVAAQVELALANASLRERLLSLSVRDHVTGLFNRRYMEETLMREIRRSRRSGQPFVVVMLDLDDFKSLNDTRGHLAGDAVLRAFGALLPGQLRGGDVACRYGGDEFVIILPESTLSGAVRRVRRLQGRVERAELDFDGLKLRFPDISAGVAAYPEHGSTAQELLASADAALYRAKAAGRNCVSA